MENKNHLVYEIGVRSFSKYNEDSSWSSGVPLTVEEVKAAITEFFNDPNRAHIDFKYTKIIGQ